MKVKLPDGNIVELSDIKLIDDDGNPILNEEQQETSLADVYDVYTNMKAWQKKNTQRSQELSKMEKEIEELRAIKQKWDEADRFFREHPDIADLVVRYRQSGDRMPVDYIKENVLKLGGETMSQEQNTNNYNGLPPEIQEKLKKYDEFIAQQTLKEKISKIKSSLKQKYSNFDEQKFDNLLESFDPSNEEAIIEALFKATLVDDPDYIKSKYSEVVKTKESADLVNPDETVGDRNIEEKTVKAGDYDQALEQYMETHDISNLIE